MKIRSCLRYGIDGACSIGESALLRIVAILTVKHNWVTTSRTKFVYEGYLKGMKDFIDRYYAMIHRAAGWAALRTFLLVR